MNILLYGIVLFLVAFFIHVLVWKLYLPRHHTKTLLLIFIATYLCGIFISWKMSRFVTFFGILFPFRSGYEIFQFSLLFMSLAFVYISTYSAVEVDSPSIVMILSIAKAGSGGLSKQGLYEIMTDDFLVKPRIRDLVAARMVVLDKGLYRLTQKGIFVAKIFIASRKLLKSPKGG